ncbi:hypothetical protein C8Q80DRAFT_231316 [Daedaleopsis nitida]|nr:hypothetical protein C8Q80DRAFT_231316 [Daedaleopsis nitida]
MYDWKRTTPQSASHPPPVPSNCFLSHLSMAFLLHDSFAILAVILGVCTCIYARHYKLPRLRFPPGPRGLPLLGNLFQIPDPNDEPWETYRTWSRTYRSDIIRVSALGTNIIVLNSLSLVNELLDKRSSHMVA